MSDYMLDLETLGTKPGSIILSIGICKFSPEGISDQLYCTVNRQSCIDLGLTCDVDTAIWWGRQSKEASRVLEDSLDPNLSLSVDDALYTVKEFFDNTNDGDSVRVWGNGANFDNALMAELYRRSHHVQPWKFYNDRCYRTLKSLFPEAASPFRHGTHHNALCDAVFQAGHASMILQYIRNLKT